MRAFCTVSAPLEVCASPAEQLSPGSRFLALRLLGNQQPKTLYFLVDAKSRVREVYTQTCLHFATQGMQDTELFGLAVLIDGEYMFADPESKLSKYGPKSWRSSHTHGLDANGRPLLELHFRVQFYVESPFILKDEPSRHNYYLQLKYNALQRDILREYSEQSMILLAGLALQADYGDAPLTPTPPPPSSSSSSTSSSAITSTIIPSSTIAAAAAATTITTTQDADVTTKCKVKATESVEDKEIVANGGGGGSNDNNNDDIAITKDGISSSTTTSSIPSSAAATTTTTAPAATSFTTTLPKISKKTNNANERVLRLSTYVSSSNHAAVSGAPSSSTGTGTSVFPISGSIKRGLGAVAATLSPSSSLLALNRTPKSTAQHATTNSSSIVNTKLNAAPAPVRLASDYFRLEDYLPAGLRTAWAANALRACHRENRGMSSADAELHYIQQACLVHESINAHTFRMRMSKSESGPGNSWFVVYAKGIKIFAGGENTQHQQHQQQQHQRELREQQTTFLWPNITKLSFERKKFEIRSGDSKIVLYATSDEKNKMLLTLCKETHQFSMKMAARLKEIIKRDDEENNCLHACYNYSRSLHLTYKNKSDQRISVISSTSSNTTSGIVSDRVHSEDELEIMINSPPAPIAAPSTESLALAHLLDHPSVSRQTSSVGQVSLKDLEEQLAALSVRQAQKQHAAKIHGGESPTELSNTSAGNSFSSGSVPTTSQRTMDSSVTTESPNSQHNIGSQCSSTCSTVVVTSQSEPAENVLTSLRVNATINANPVQRRNSTSSSLELGFSHTAQNSTLSEAESTCITHNFSAATQDETESVSGVYTLTHGAPPTETSGVYTMHSSEMTGQSSEIAESEKSSHYGIFQPPKSEISDDHLRRDHADSVDGNNYRHGKRLKTDEFRLRSDSNISTSGSFRGDGSDPTDNKHNLLSAEELTDLIVGRGTYPSRKTVSSTLDSDCDYVTLPLTLEGESYIQGHQDTAPSEDNVETLLNDFLPPEPPAPPQRVDSNNLQQSSHASLSNIRARSPPPYNSRHETTGLRGPLVRNSLPAKSPVSRNMTVAPPLTVPEPRSKASLKTASSVSLIPEPSASKSNISAAASVPQPLTQSNVAIRRRDPPPYPSSSKQRPTSLISVATSGSSLDHSVTALQGTTAGGSTSSLKSEEVPARFITSRPQINILKAHTSIVNENTKPSYAAPTHCSSAASSTGSISSYHIPSHLSQNSTHNSNYASGSQMSLNLGGHLHTLGPKATNTMSAAAVAHAAAAAAAGAGVIPSTIGIPIVPYSLHGAHKSMSSLHQQPPPPPPPYTELKSSGRTTCVLLPVIKSRQFIPPPPPSLPRQPPPPPPPQLAGVYTPTQLARKQLELYQQQLYSDVDYVIYPIQDPAVSQQEYLDAKQGSILAAMAQAAPPPPHSYLTAYHTATPHGGPMGWDTCKGHAIYRSTPYLPLALSTHSRYASTQNLSDTYVQLPSAYSPLYSPSMASLCSSYEPPPPPPLHPAALAAAAANQSNYFARSRSDDNILNTLDAIPKVKRLPPPPPPPYVNRRLKKPPMPTPPSEKPPPIPSKPHAATNTISCGMPKPTRSQLSLATSGKPVTLRTSRSTTHMTKTSSGAHWAGERPKTDLELNRLSSSNNSILAQLQASLAAANRQSMPIAPSSHSKSSTASHNSTSTSAGAASTGNAESLDIASLREKSKNLDLPLISALCNDRSLLKQTKVLTDSKQNRNSLPTTHQQHSLNMASTTSSSALTSPNAAAAAAASTTLNSMSSTSSSNHSSSSKSLATMIVKTTPGTTITTTTTTGAVVNGNSPTSNNSNNSNGNNINGISTPSAGKYHSMSAATLSGSGSGGSKAQARKVLISHRHPNDKLPPLPVQLAEANNYVMDPAIMLKHHQKNHNA